MRQFSIIFFVIIFLVSCNESYSAIHGRIDYSIPVDYSKLSESELESKAKIYYHNALQYKDNYVNSDITNALVFYSALQKINPLEIKYYVRAGVLYDKISKDRQAKGNFFKAISINNQNPEAYFYLGEFYYKRQSYKHALKNYLKAYSKGYDSNYDTLYKLGDIYQKLGDTRSAIKYLDCADKINPNDKLKQKLNLVRAENGINKEYYKNK